MAKRKEEKQYRFVRQMNPSLPQNASFSCRPTLKRIIFVRKLREVRGEGKRRRGLGGEIGGRRGGGHERWNMLV